MESKETDSLNKEEQPKSYENENLNRNQEPNSIQESFEFNDLNTKIDQMTDSDDLQTMNLFQSVLNDTEANETSYEHKYKFCTDLVLTVDDNQLNEIDLNEDNFKKLNKLNSLSNGDFIDEDFVPNKLNISREYSDSDDEFSNLKWKESNLVDEKKLNNLNLKNNLNEFNKDFKIIEQKEKIFLPSTQTSKNKQKISLTLTNTNKSSSMEDLKKKKFKHQSILNDDLSSILSKATVLNRNDLSGSSSLSSSYSNINSNPIKSSSNSLINHFELKFDSLSSIEDNSKFNLNTNALTDSTLLITAIESDSQDQIEVHDFNNDNIAIKNKSHARIWTETEAFINQYDQVGPSACGATAILNVLKALNYDFELETVCSKVKIKSRIPENLANVTTLADYLFSRSVAGMNSFELIENIERCSENKVTGRFFSFYPQKEINLSKWLASWIRKGAIPVALLNLQKTPLWGFIPDAWHHQMIYACDTNSIYLTNPLESKSIDTIMNELTSESVLLVRSYDVIKRFNANKYNLLDLLLMKNHSDEEKKRWFEMNVLGQVLNIIREQKTIYENIINKLSNQIDNLEAQSSNQIENLNTSITFDLLDHQSDNTNTQNSLSLQISSNINSNSNLSSITHIKIPASYKSGITLFCYRDSNLYKEILGENELPIKK